MYCSLLLVLTVGEVLSNISIYFIFLLGSSAGGDIISLRVPPNRPLFPFSFSFTGGHEIKVVSINQEIDIDYQSA